MDFLSVLIQLSRPWTYLKISSKGKPIFDWLVPVVVAGLITLMLHFAVGKVSIFGAGGLVHQLTGFVQSLPGFFIAALAAVATFNRDDLDTLLPAPTPTMVVLNRGRPVPLELTRRRFLCSLFSFLTAQSLFVTCAGIFGSGLAEWVVGMIPGDLVQQVRLAGAFVYLLMLLQLLSVTCLGLYYLGDRLHLPDQ